MKRQQIGMAALCMGLLIANSANAQWTHTGSVTYLTNGGDNVGIGTTAPSYKLDIKNAANCNFRVQSTSTGSANLILSRSSAAGTNALVNYKTGVTDKWFTGLKGNNDDFSIQDATGTAVVYITQSSKNVGIGTTTPAYTLDANDGTSFIRAKASSGYAGVIIDKAADVQNGYVVHRSANTTLWTEGTKGNNNFSLYNWSAASEALTVDVANNNVGLGTVTPASKLHVVHPSGLYSQGFRLQREGTADYWTFYVSSFGTSGDLWFNNNGMERGEFSSANGVYTSVSDRRLKSDIREVGSVLEKVMKLGVKNYYITSDASRRNNLGLIAQDVEPLFPELVYHSVGEGKDIYTMDYAGFGVVSIKAIQEQQKLIEKQNEKIAALESMINACCENNTASKSSGTNMQLNENKLFQNQPNPFNESTVIRYSIADAGNAQIIIRDLKGNLIKAIPLTEKGRGQVTINANELAQGTYTYTLQVNSEGVDAKLLVVTK